MEHGQTHMVLEWRVPPGQAHSIAAALQQVMFLTRLEEGCLGCEVNTSASDRVTVRYAEEWDNEEHLRAHVRSDHFRVLATLVESASEPPRIEFVLPAGTRGMDYAIEVRGHRPTGHGLPTPF